jgi:hypothetical protein
MQFKILTYLNFFSLFLILCVAVLNLQCKKPTPPDVDDTPKPGKRDYTWTIDTLAYPGSLQTLMRDIWASSPTNVYVVGHNDQNKGMMYKYEGQKWTPVKLTWSEGGPIQSAIGLTAVCGFGTNDIYAVGSHIFWDPIAQKLSDSSLIIHFDGVSWREEVIKKQRRLQSIAGISYNNVTALGGGVSSIFHFNGNSWETDSLPIEVPKVGEFQFASVAVVSENELYALGTIHINDIPKDIYYFLHRVNSKWKIIDTAVIEIGKIEIKWGYSKLWKSPWGKLYSVGLGVFVWNGFSWSKIFNSDAWLSKIFGTSENNIFIVGQGGIVYHFNGIDWYRFPSFPPLMVTFTYEWFMSGWTDGNEVFIVGQDSQSRRTLILHGK